MQNQQINLTPLEVATILEGLKDHPSETVVRICTDKENVISVYGASALLFTVNRQ